MLWGCYRAGEVQLRGGLVDDGCDERKGRTGLSVVLGEEDGHFDLRCAVR